ARGTWPDRAGHRRVRPRWGRKLRRQCGRRPPLAPERAHRRSRPESIAAGDSVLRARLGRLLIKPDHVSGRVAESRRDLRRVSPDWLHDYAPVGDDLVQSFGHAVHHHIEEKAGLGREGRAWWRADVRAPKLR